MSGTIPKWADEKAAQVLTMFARGDTEHIDRALLHGAFAAALVQERERCAEEANGIDPKLLESMSDFAVSVYCRSRVDAAKAIRQGSE